MLHVIFCAAGKFYQMASISAAATFRRHFGSDVKLCVYLTPKDRVESVLKASLRRYDIELRTISLNLVSKRKIITQFKSEVFVHALQQSRGNDFLLFADADTFCHRRFNVSALRKVALRDGLGAVPDIIDWHPSDPSLAWYLPPSERAVYFNSGVLIATRGSIDIFRLVQKLSHNITFLQDPFEDQKILNYVAGKYFKARLVILNEAFNCIWPRIIGNTDYVIGHFARGVGEFNCPGNRRYFMHRKYCAAELDGSL